MANLEKLVEELSALTVLEAAELSKLLETKWGVSAAAPVADGLHQQGALDLAGAQSHCVAGLEFTRGLDHHAVDLHPTSVDLVAGQAAGLVKTCSPQPFVNAN